MVYVVHVSHYQQAVKDVHRIVQSTQLTELSVTFMSDLDPEELPVELRQQPCGRLTGEPQLLAIKLYE